MTSFESAFQHSRVTIHMKSCADQIFFVLRGCVILRNNLCVLPSHSPLRHLCVRVCVCACVCVCVCVCVPVHISYWKEGFTYFLRLRSFNVHQWNSIFCKTDQMWDE